MKCLIGLHKWGEWDQPTFHQFHYDRGLFSNDFYAGYRTARSCLRCGRFQEKEISEREIQAKKDYEFSTFMLKKSSYFADRGDLDMANWYLKLAETPYREVLL